MGAIFSCFECAERNDAVATTSSAAASAAATTSSVPASGNQLVKEYAEATLPGMPRELREMVYDYVYEPEVTIWILRHLSTKESPARSPVPFARISRHADLSLLTVNRRIYNELVARPVRVTAKTNLDAFASDLRLLPFVIPASASPSKIHVQLYKATVNASQYCAWLWDNDAAQLARTMPKLEVVRVGVLPPSRGTAINDALTIAELDIICQEVVSAHPGLNTFSHVVNSGSVISYTISK